METAVALAIIGLKVARSNRKKKAKQQFNNLPDSEKQRIIKEDKIRKQQADELIAIILPTIKNSKQLAGGYIVDRLNPGLIY